MNWLFILTLKSILGSVIGSSFYAWFKNTRVGVWFQKHVDRTLAWVAHRYHLEILSREDKWLQQYPLLASRIVELERQVSILAKENDILKKESKNSTVKH